MSIETDMPNRRVPRDTSEAFHLCRDYQQSKGYGGLTMHEVEYLIGNRPCQSFIAQCGQNVTTTRSGGDIIYSFNYKRL